MDDEPFIESTQGEAAPADAGGADPQSDATQSWSPEVQAEYTKKTQALAEERKSWEAERDKTAATHQQQAAYLQQVAQQMQQRAQQAGQAQQQAQQPDPYQPLREMGYVDGNTAAQLFSGLQQAMGQRDLALQQMFKEMSEVRKTVQGSQQKASASEFDTKLADTLTGLGIPDELKEDMLEHVRDVALSHEGKGLMKELPDLTKQRLESMRKISRALDKAESEAARKQRAIPGSQGGTASPSNPLKPGYRSPKQLADELWSTFETMPNE